MKLEKILVAFVIINAAIGSYFTIKYFRIPWWIENADIPEIFDVFSIFKDVIGYVSILFVIIGIIQLIMRNKIELVRAFYFPIYYYIITTLFYYIQMYLSTRYSFIPENLESPYLFVLFKVISFSYIGVAIYYAISVGFKKKKGDAAIVSKSGRFVNYLIDSFIIMTISFTNLRFLSHGSIFEDNEYLNSNPYWYFALHIFIYYFVLEFLFLQTIGKLHNNSYIQFEGSKLKAIYIRTIVRFIPFEAFSFFGKNGWHDHIAKTKVIKGIPDEAEISQTGID